MEIDMSDYPKILANERTNTDFNFVSLQGGKYKLTRNWFKKVYLQLKDKFKDGESGSLVFKVTPAKSYPLFIDIDVRLKQLPTDVDIGKCYQGLISMILGIFSAHFGGDNFAEVIATRRPEIYKKEDFFRAGFHLYIIGQYSLETSQKLREHVLKDLDIRGYFDEIFGKHNMDLKHNTSDHIYDSALSDRRNGCLLIGSNKPGYTCGAHFVFLHGLWRNGWNDGPAQWEAPGWYLKNDEIREKYNKALIRLYSFIWKKPPTPVEVS